MSTVLGFTGGVRCEDCDEQIPVERVRAIPNVKRCVPCQGEQNRRLQLMFQTLRDDDVVIIRGGRYQL